jgi:thiol-disulfide isomerase/thioredoxin
MGRLPALALTMFAACACDADAKNAPSAPRERSQAIADLAPAAPASATAAAPPPPSAPAKPKEPRILCGGHSSGPGKLFPKKPVGRAAAPGAPELAENLAIGGGKWTWVNFWAAWCAPCKEEIPRLQRFEQQLTRAGTAFRLAFITLDDDPRQLDKFLAAQSPEGLRTSYWLREGKERDEWLQAAGMEPDPALPVHLLVDPQGKVRCTVKGAIEDGDYSQIAALVSK